MARIGLLSISDGRDFVARDLVDHMDGATNESMARQSTFEWPHAFTRLLGVEFEGFGDAAI
ncbi:hypothetical protein GCM10022419_069880 [Nonomuraea rosea]|uniref:Uncharacterized protein n=1 Tax=Nonomuraea rosea TaxID=638574 RepID=A0ABP6YBL2_9ACTN